MASVLGQEERAEGSTRMIVVWSPRAAGHLAQLRGYIGRDDLNAAAGVAGKILRSVELLAQQPGMGRAGRVVATRELELIDVFHGRQKWSDRL